MYIAHKLWLSRSDHPALRTLNSRQGETFAITWGHFALRGWGLIIEDTLAGTLSMVSASASLCDRKRPDFRKEGPIKQRRGRGQYVIDICFENGAKKLCLRKKVEVVQLFQTLRLSFNLQKWKHKEANGVRKTCLNACSFLCSTDLQGGLLSYTKEDVSHRETIIFMKFFC